MYVKQARWLTLAFASSVDLAILFFLLILSSTERTVLKSLSKFVDFCGLTFTSVVFIYFEVILLGGTHLELCYLVVELSL